MRHPGSEFEEYPFAADAQVTADSPAANELQVLDSAVLACESAESLRDFFEHFQRFAEITAVVETTLRRFAAVADIGSTIATFRQTIASAQTRIFRCQRMEEMHTIGRNQMNSFLMNERGKQVTAIPPDQWEHLTNHSPRTRADLILASQESRTLESFRPYLLTQIPPEHRSRFIRQSSAIREQIPPENGLWIGSNQFILENFPLNETVPESISAFWESLATLPPEAKRMVRPFIEYLRLSPIFITAVEAGAFDRCWDHDTLLRNHTNGVNRSLPNHKDLRALLAFQTALPPELEETCSDDQRMQLEALRLAIESPVITTHAARNRQELTAGITSLAKSVHTALTNDISAEDGLSQQAISHIEEHAQDIVLRAPLLRGYHRAMIAQTRRSVDALGKKRKRELLGNMRAAHEVSESDLQLLRRIALDADSVDDYRNRLHSLPHRTKHYLLESERGGNSVLKTTFSSINALQPSDSSELLADIFTFEHRQSSEQHIRALWQNSFAYIRIFLSPLIPCFDLAVDEGLYDDHFRSASQSET